MPDEGDEVWCGLDPSGEGGCILGTRQNGKDRPKETDPDKKRRDFAGGSFITHDPATGTHTMEISGTLVLKVVTARLWPPPAPQRAGLRHVHNDVVMDVSWWV